MGFTLPVFHLPLTVLLPLPLLADGFLLEDAVTPLGVVAVANFLQIGTTGVGMSVSA